MKTPWCVPGDTVRLTATGEEAVVVAVFTVNVAVRRAQNKSTMWFRKDVTVVPKEGRE